MDPRPRPIAWGVLAGWAVIGVFVIVFWVALALLILRVWGAT